MKKINLWPAFYSFCFILTLPTLVWADALIPYFTVPLGQAFLLPLIIVIETVIVKIILKMQFLIALWRTFVVNLASTAFGAVLYFILMPLVGNPLWNVWMKYDVIGAILISFTFTIILCGFSWLIESMVAITLIRNIDKNKIYSVFLKANICSYVLLWLLSLLFL